MLRLPLACLFLSLAFATPAWCQAESGPACAIPANLVTPSAPLAGVAAALTAGRALDILALGSGSTVGQSSGSHGPALSNQALASSFPYRMVAALRSMRPGLRLNLTVDGGRNMTAEAMLPILRQALSAHHYDLVLWQTGTVEAVHGIRPERLRGVLADGAEAAAIAHADLVLIDPQFSRFLRANADLGPYQTVLRQMTATQGVTLFPRFDLTQEWVSSGQIDLERVAKDQRDATIGLLNDCLGQALARYVLTGAGEP
jgi:hypothetical protein